jgi:hypothetical protein
MLTDFEGCRLTLDDEQQLLSWEGDKETKLKAKR